MLDLLLRYVTLSKSLNDSIGTDQFSTFAHCDSSNARSVSSFIDSEDSFLDLVSITDEVDMELRRVDEEFREADPRYTGRYRGDITGQVLRDDFVREARANGLQYFI